MTFFDGINMNDNDEPRIIVDDDWKAQVQREKEQLDQNPDQQLPEMPEASFGLLVTTLTTQALAALGFIVDPVTGKGDADRPMAKHFVDTLGVLQEKTIGNLTSEESHLLDQSLHQLRMAYISTADSDLSDIVDVVKGSESKRSTIELP